MKIRVGSRESKLAIIQAEIVINAIKSAHPEIEIELITMKTTGDIILNKTLDKIGGKGLFVKELDMALLEERVDITVHSFKDMPMQTDERLPLIAASARENPYDVLVLPKDKTEIDFSKPIGCSSSRRAILLKKLYPECTVEPIRGNVITRLEKLDRGEFSATTLAYAGLKRLDLLDRVSRIFTKEEMLPASCQAVLVVQARHDFDASILKEFHNDDAYITSMAERSFTATLDGGCSSPIACFGEISGDKLTLTGMYVSPNGKVLEGKIFGNRNDGVALGKELALGLKKDGVLC